MKSEANAITNVAILIIGWNSISNLLNCNGKLILPFTKKEKVQSNNTIAARKTIKAFITLHFIVKKYFLDHSDLSSLSTFAYNCQRIKNCIAHGAMQFKRV